MFYRDYTKEIGMVPPGKTISWPYVVLILAVLAVAVAWYASVQLKAFHATHDHHDQATMAQTTVAPSLKAPSIAPRTPAHQPRHPAA